VEKTVLIINEKDNVAVALRNIEAGTKLSLPGEDELTTVTDIPYGHKIALVTIAEGDPVIKYGEVIGQGFREIIKGEWVHTHT
jgi:altronate hydrolase